MNKFKMNNGYRVWGIPACLAEAGRGYREDTHPASPLRNSMEFQGPKSRKSFRFLGGTPHPKFQFGFTLMELMVVIAIIALLAGIMTPNVARRLERAKMTRTEADIAAMETAIAMYENDLGSYPPGGVDYLETCLTGIDSAGAYDPKLNTRWSGPYIKGIGEDSWGKEYVYIKNTNPKKLGWKPLPRPTEYPFVGADPANDYPDTGYGSPINAPDSLSYYIYSTGKNKATGTGKNADDINNWDVDKSWQSEY